MFEIMDGVVRWKKPWKRVIWYRTFDSRSHKETFNVGSEGRSINVRMMHVTAAFRVANLDEYDARAIQLPFAQSLREMVIILPNRDDTDVAQLEKSLMSDLYTNWNRLVSQLQRGLYHVALPQFDVETTSSRRWKSNVDRHPFELLSFLAG